MSIPKTIHYVWVGDKPLTPLAKRCIASWKKHLLDYELKLWDESNSPMSHPYMQAMYAKKKWAFVSDYIRFWVLEKEGGIYLDTDTEVLKSFDPLLTENCFFGKTSDGVVAAGVIGAVAGHSCVRDILQVYDSDTDFSIDRTSPKTVTAVLHANEYPDVSVYGYEYFNPCDDGEKCTSEKLTLAYTRNHWAESWVSHARLRKMLRRIGLMKVIKRLAVRST